MKTINDFTKHAKIKATLDSVSIGNNSYWKIELLEAISFEYKHKLYYIPSGEVFDYIDNDNVSSDSVEEYLYYRGLASEVKRFDLSRYEVEDWGLAD